MHYDDLKPNENLNTIKRINSKFVFMLADAYFNSSC